MIRCNKERQVQDQHRKLLVSMACAPWILLGVHMGIVFLGSICTTHITTNYNNNNNNNYSNKNHSLCHIHTPSSFVSSTIFVSAWAHSSLSISHRSRHSHCYKLHPTLVYQATSSSSSPSSKNEDNENDDGADGTTAYHQQQQQQQQSDHTTIKSRAPPTLPSGLFKPKQSLGQNFLKDGNTVQKIIKAFLKDASKSYLNTTVMTTTTKTPNGMNIRAIELGPGAGALTDSLVVLFTKQQQQQQQNQQQQHQQQQQAQATTSSFQCIEIDSRSVQLLTEKHPLLDVQHMDVLQVDYPTLAKKQGGPLAIIGNLPYYITSQILFTFVDASHTQDTISSATVTMQFEVAQRIVAQPHTKEYGILSVVFQLYTQPHLHFKIPPTVFYPQPKVDSALVGFHFYDTSSYLTTCIFNIATPKQLRQVLSTCFQQRRKTLRNSLKKLILDLCQQDVHWVEVLLNNTFHSISSSYSTYTQDMNKILPTTNTATTTTFNNNNNNNNNTTMLKMIPIHWATLRPEQLSPLQFVGLTEWLYVGRYQCRPKTHYPSTSPSTDTVIIEDSYYEKEEEEITMESSAPIILGTKVWRRLKHGTND